MFGEIFGFVKDVAQLVWPFRIVEQWEGAGIYVGGRMWRETGPGLKVVVPWFMDVKTVSTADAIVGTNRQDITIKDKSLLSFTATAVVRVTDVNKALNAVDDYKESARELLSSVLADRLADYDTERLQPSGRGRLITDLTRWINEESAQYGLHFEKVRFTSFVLNLKTHRLLMDTTQAFQW